MSNLIRSSQIMLDDATFKLKSNITIANKEFIQNAENEELGSPIEDTMLIQKAYEIARIIEDNAKNDAHEIIEASRAEAIEIEKQALGKSDEIYQNAQNSGYEAGYDAGYQAGFEEGQNQAHAIIEEANALKEQIRQERAQLILNSESELAKLSLAIASKILNMEVASNDYIKGIIKEGMNNLIAARDVVIRVSESDYDFATYLKPQIFLMTKNIDKLEIKKDLSMQRGDCIIENLVSGSIDVGIRTQLERIKEEFEMAFRERE